MRRKGIPPENDVGITEKDAVSAVQQLTDKIQLLKYDSFPSGVFVAKRLA